MNAATNQVFQFCAEGFSAFLSGLEGSHQACGVLRVDGPRFGKQLAFFAVESVKRLAFGFAFDAEQPEEARAFWNALWQHRHTFRHQFREVVDVSGVLVVIAHERFSSSDDAFLGVSKCVGDPELLVDEDDVRWPVIEVVELVSDSEEEIVRLIKLASFGVVDELVFDELACGLDALFEKADPE